MTIATDAVSGIEVVMPYGNANGALHFRFKNDYRTFCGRECDGWSTAEMTFREAIDYAWTCKRCHKAAFK